MKVEPGSLIEYRLAGEKEMKMALVTHVIPAPFSLGECAFMAATYGAVNALLSKPHGVTTKESYDY